MDITEEMRFIINWLITEIQHIWSLMHSIEFFGTNLLNFIITITVLGALGTIVITRAQDNTVLVEDKEKRTKYIKKGK